MTSDTTSQARANHNGSPCPRWCTSNHQQVTAHFSDAMVNDWPEPRVQVLKDGWGADGDVMVTFGAGDGLLTARPAEAAGLAAVLEALEELVRYEPSRLREYAAQVRAAAAIALEA